MTRIITDFDLARQGFNRAERRHFLRTGTFKSAPRVDVVAPSALLMRLLAHADIIPKFPAVAARA